jgi:hypothetical protein
VGYRAGLKVYDVLHRTTLVMSIDAVREIEQRLGCSDPLDLETVLFHGSGG